MITMALAKGRIYQETLPFLAAAGIYPVEDPEKSRKLMIATNRDDLRIVVIRATDVPTYVQYGAADIGVCGWDTLYEHGGNGLFIPVDLQIAKCRMSVAAPNGLDYDGLVRRGGRIRIATKFMKWASDYFAGCACRSDQALRIDGARADRRTCRRDCRYCGYRRHPESE